MVTAPETRYSLRLIALYRLFVALFLLWIGALAPLDHAFAPVQPAYFTLVAGVYLFLAFGLAIPAIMNLPQWSETQVIFGALLDVIAISLALLTGGGVVTGIGLLLIPAVAATALLTSGRRSLLIAALATLAVLVSEWILAPRLPWGYPTATTQSGLLGATLFIAALLAWRLAQRANRSEATVVRQEQDLAKLAELNSQIIARMDSGVVAVDSSGFILSINEAAQRLLPAQNPKTLRDLSPRLATAVRRWSSESLLQGTSLQGAPPQGTPPRESSLQENPPQGTPPEVTPLQGTHTLAGDADQLALEVRITPLGVTAPSGMLLILEDASEIQRRVHASKLQSLGRLTGSIAHEIRNPLSAINHSAQLLAESENLDAGDRRLVQIIEQQGQRVERLIRSILSLSSGRPAQRERLRLLERLQRFADEFAATVRQPRERLDIEVQPADAEIPFDPTQLQQVLVNLCMNALIHAGHDQPGASPIILRAKPGRSNQGMILDVMDSGPGVSEQVLEALFEPFNSTAPGGTGLGLYISRLLCISNGAALEYVQRPDGGCFRILFAPVANLALSGHDHRSVGDKTPDAATPSRTR